MRKLTFVPRGGKACAFKLIMNKLENAHYSELNEFYGGLLTEKQRLMLVEYYDDDLSLGEIAQKYDVSRQAVRDSVQRAQAALIEFEDKVGLKSMFGKIRQIRKRVAELQIKDENLKTMLEEVLNGKE